MTPSATSQRRYDLLGIGVSVLDFTMVVESFPSGESVMRALDRASGLGGGVAVATATAAKLGGVSAMIDLLGADAASQSLLEKLSEAGVDTSFIQREADQLASLATVMVRSGDGARSIIFSPGTDREPDYSDSIDDAVASARILHINGRHPDLASQAIAAARRHGVLVSYDGGAHRYRDSTVPLLRQTDILIVAEQFARASWSATESVQPSSGSSVTLPELADHLMIRFDCRLVGVTAGAKGSWFATDEPDHWHQPAVTPRRLRDTTGCGDTFHGAFLLALAQGKPPRRASELASLVASRNAETLGALAFVPDQELLDAFRD